MRTLLIESSPGAAADAAADLAAAGVEIVRCHEPDSDSFACRALLEPGSCPLHGTDRPDVILAVRAEGDQVVTGTEAGVTCGVRHGIPVVVDGPDPTDAGPFAGWAEPRGDRDRRTACEEAVATAHDRLVGPLEAEVRRMLDPEGQSDPDVAVTVHRDGANAQIQVAIPTDAPVTDEKVSVRVHARYRQVQLDGAATHVDVGVLRRSGS